MKDPHLLGGFVASSTAALAFAAAGSRLALATSDLVLEKGHAAAWALALVALGALILALAHLKSPRRRARLAARVAAGLVAALALGVFAAPGVAMLR